MFPGDVLAGDISTPGPTPQGEREGHAVDIVAAVAVALRLSHHDPADTGLLPQFPDSVVPRGVQAAGVAAPNKPGDALDVLDRFGEALELPECQDRRELLARERILCADRLPMDHQEPRGFGDDHARSLRDYPGALPGDPLVEVGPVGPHEA